MPDIRVAIIDDCFSPGHSHGAMCLEIFKNSSRCEHLVLIPVANRPGENIPAPRIADAIRKAQRARADLVVMSMGTSNPLVAAPIIEETQKAVDAGVKMVCACSNEQIITFPASLPGVIGVRNSKKTGLSGGAYAYVANPPDGINVISSVPAKSLFPKEAQSADIASNSITTQFVGAMIYNLLVNCSDYSGDVGSLLYRRSGDYAMPNNYYPQLFHLDPAERGPIVELQGNSEEAMFVAEAFSALLAEDGFCAGVVGREIAGNIGKLHFAIEKLFVESGTTANQKVSMLFRMAKIDLAFLLPGVGDVPKDAVMPIGDIVLPGASIYSSQTHTRLRQAYETLRIALG